MMEADKGSMQLLDVVCESMSLPPMERIDVDGVIKLAELILEQTRGHLRNNLRMRSRTKENADKSGEMLMNDLFEVWLQDREKLPFDCKFPTIVFAKYLQGQGVEALVAFERYQELEPHPYVVVRLEENEEQKAQQILIGFIVGFTPERGIFHDQDVSVVEMNEVEKKFFGRNFCYIRDINLAMQFGDLRQQFNFAYCDQSISGEKKQELTRDLRQKMDILTADL